MDSVFDRGAPEKIEMTWLRNGDSNPVEKPATESNSPESNPFGTQQPTDWTEPATASAGSATRTVGPAENNATPAVAVNDEVPAGGHDAVFEDTSNDTLLRDFMQSIEKRADETKPDPFLTALMKGDGPQESPTTDPQPKSEESETAGSPADAAPAVVDEGFEAFAAANSNPEIEASAELQNDSAEQRFAGRHPVVISLTGNLLKVGSNETLSIEQLSDQQILDATLEGLAQEMEDQPPTNGRFALPFVDFKVTAANLKRQLALARQLDRMDVPTRSVQRVNSRENRGLFRRSAPKRESADPIDIRPPQRTGRGFSL